MRNASVLIAAVVLAGVAVPLTGPARAQEFWPVIPPEQGIFPVVRPAPVPWRCSDGPVWNFYHGAYYREVPAVYRGFAYRQHYRYTAWQLVPRTYTCSAAP
jgi:hypothetical protein